MDITGPRVEVGRVREAGVVAVSPNSVRLGWGMLRFFAGQGAKRTVIATPSVVVGTTALSPVAAAAATVAGVVLTAYTVYSAARWMLQDA